MIACFFHNNHQIPLYFGASIPSHIPYFSSQSSSTLETPQEHHHAKVYDLNASLASHCSLHSCTSSEFNPAAENSPASYSTSISTDTLYWEPHSETTSAASGASASHGKKSSAATAGGSGTNRSQQQPHTHQHHYYVQKYVNPHTGQIQPIAMYAATTAGGPQPVHKPKSWDNLAMKSYGGYGYGYGYLEIPAKAALPAAQTRTQTTITIQHRNSIPSKKNGYEQRYSAAFVDVENYAPPPTQFLQETTTTTTTITTKSTENLLGPYAVSDTSLACECLEGPGQAGSSGVVNAAMEILHDKSGYYSSLGGGGAGGTGAGGSGSSGKKQMANLTEIARL